MKVKFAVAAFAAMLLAPVAMPASAQFYINAGVTGYQFDNDRSPTAFTGRAGYDAGPYVAVEGEAGFGIIKDNDFKLESEFGAFVLGKLPLYGDKFHGYLRIGYTLINASDFDDDGFAFGIGGQYKWGRQGIRVDWTRHDYDAGNVDAFSIAFAQGF